MPLVEMSLFFSLNPGQIVNIKSFNRYYEVPIKSPSPFLIWRKEWQFSLWSQGILLIALFLLFVWRHNCKDMFTIIKSVAKKYWFRKTTSGSKKLQCLKYANVQQIVLWKFIKFEMKLYIVVRNPWNYFYQSCHPIQVCCCCILGFLTLL